MTRVRSFVAEYRKNLRRRAETEKDERSTAPHRSSAKKITLARVEALERPDEDDDHDRD